MSGPLEAFNVDDNSRNPTLETSDNTNQKANFIFFITFSHKKPNRSRLDYSD